MSVRPDLGAILRSVKTIAVVGASDSPWKHAHAVPAYMQSHGYRIIPVNPNTKRVLGQDSFASLDEIEEPVDMVNVFRPSDLTPPIAEQAVRIGAKVLWLQLGISSEEAERIATEGGLTVVMDTCLEVAHKQYAL